MIARVVVENAAYSFDMGFSYQVPQTMQGDIRPGCRVLVPFGRANRTRQGLVLALEEETGPEEKIKPVRTLLDYQPLLNEEQLWLLEWLHKRVFCTYYEAMRAVVPSGMTVKVRVMCSLASEEALPECPRFFIFCGSAKNRFRSSRCSLSWESGKMHRPCRVCSDAVRFSFRRRSVKKAPTARL